MRRKFYLFLIGLGIVGFSFVSFSAPKPLLTDKSQPLDEHLDQLFSKPEPMIFVPEEIVPKETALEPVPIALARTLELEHLYHPRVQFYLDYFTGPAREIFSIWLNRAGIYQDYIQAELKEHNLPESLFYLAMIESGLNPYAMSRRGAGGIWQFIPSTARRYGLRVDFWVDERRDFEKSTKAAIAYLTDLYQRFGSWPLALAGYNAGEGKVSWVIEKNGVDNYWELIELPGLKRETKDYLPKMIAACILAENPEEYGFVKGGTPLGGYEKLLVKDAVDLAKVAEIAGVSLEELARMNPALLRGISPPGSQYELRVPSGSGEKLLAVYQTLKPEERISYLHHRVKKGETLSKISQKYGVSVEELRQFNHLSRVHQLKVGQNLIIPISKGKEGAILAYSQVDSKKSAGKTVRNYRVKPGDSLWSIARSAGVTVEELKRWNNLKDSTIRVNQVLVLYPNRAPAQTLASSGGSKKSASAKTAKAERKTQGTASKPKQAPQKKVYEVKAGDTLWAISRKYEVSPQDLMKWNNLNPSSTIKPGDKLLILTD